MTDMAGEKPAVRVEYTQKACTPAVLKHLYIHDYNEKNEANLARRASILLNNWLNVHAEKVTLPLNPAIRPIMIQESINIRGTFFTAMAVISFGRLDTKNREVILKGDLYLTTNDEAAQIINDVMNRTGTTTHIVDDDED